MLNTTNEKAVPRDRRADSPTRSHDEAFKRASGLSEAVHHVRRRFRFEVDEQSYDRVPSDIVAIPRGAWHGFTCRSPPARVCTANGDTPAHRPAIRPTMRAIAPRH